MAFLFSLVTEFASAQQTPSPVWCFGHNARLDFTGASPATGQASVHSPTTVSSTQCDANGKVLFYADGMKIRDADGNPMPGSQHPLWTTYVGGYDMNTRIVPDASDSNLYYVFTTFPSKGELPYGRYYVGQLTYSVVDMRLNGGMGDVVNGRNHILLDTSCGHNVVIVPGLGCAWWAVVQAGSPAGDDASFKCYRIDHKGVDPRPVVSRFNVIPSLFPNGNGTGVGLRYQRLIYSYTKKKIIATYETADITSYDFDEATGKVSKPVALTWAFPNTEHWVGSCSLPAICLSPDESQLYVSGYYSAGPNEGGFYLRQFPLFMSGQILYVGNPVTLFAYDPGNAIYFARDHSDGFSSQYSGMQLGAD
ncbi:MAG: lactonase family protein, partial [Taibaiella sp.]|nr:lactonase family protein [Taibaiella sp.]